MPSAPPPSPTGPPPAGTPSPKPKSAAAPACGLSSGPGATRPAVPRHAIKEVFFCPCGAKFNVTGVKSGARIQCSRCRAVHVLTPEKVRIEKVQKEFVNTRRLAKPAPSPPPPPPDATQPPEEEVIPAPHLIASVRESLRLLGTFLCLALLACFWAPFQAAGGTRMAWQVMSDDVAAPAFTDKFLVGYPFVAGLAALLVAWLARGNVRGGLVLLAAAPAWAVPLWKDPARVAAITGGGGLLRLVLAAAVALAAAAAWARFFFPRSWTARGLMFVLGAGVVVLHFVPADIGAAGRTSVMALVLEEAKSRPGAWWALLPLGIGVTTFFATFPGRGGKAFAAILVLAAAVWYLLDPLRQGYGAWRAGGKTIVGLFDVVRAPTAIGACAFLSVLGLGDAIACALLRHHILKLKEAR